MKEEDGQVTIEALLIFGAFILILTTVSIPNVFKAQNAARDVQFVADARYATEQLASAANSITSIYDKKNIVVYVPGYASVGNDTGGNPIIHMGTRICSPNGSNLVTTVLIVRRDSAGTITKQENYTFSVPLVGTNWTVITPSGSGDTIFEDQGRWRNFTVSWKSINTTTENPAAVAGFTCTQTVQGIIGGGF
jgi:hypothetical protein